MPSLPLFFAKPVDFVPIWLVERLSRGVFRKVLNAHPDLFERLGDYRRIRYGFYLTDLSLHFTVVPETRTLIAARERAHHADAAIEGPLVLLLALLEGRCDADALFFSRELNVTGDMEAMLALRNALDGCGIDLPSEIGAIAGPFSPLVAGTVRYVRSRALEGRSAAWN